MVFTHPDDIISYLPAIGLPSSLTSDLFNPLSSASGALGGEVVALQLNVDFSDAGLLPSTIATKLGDLTLCGQVGLPALNGMHVRDLLALANTLLGGGTGVYSASQIFGTVASVNDAFEAGAVSSYAQDEFVIGACP